MTKKINSAKAPRLVLLLALGGCTGQVSDGGDGTPATPGGGSSGTRDRGPDKITGGSGGKGGSGTTMSPGGGPGTAPPAVPTDPSNPSNPGNPTTGGPPAMACKPGGDGLTLRRLTRDEYDNTIRDLLGDVSGPARSFPADSTSGGFDNNVATLTMPPLLAEAYHGAAEKIIEDAWTREAGAPAAMRKLRKCELVAGKEKECGKQILDAFMPLAWRRPVTPEEVTRYLGVLDLAKANGQTPETGMKLALSAVLSSANFLFRIEADGDLAKPMGQYALASRLSYFLWGSMPDATLMGLAAQGTLSKPETLRAEAKRMLADPKAIALTRIFAGQWLDLRHVDGINPDDKIFPDLSSDLKRSLRAETELFFGAFLKEDRSALDMLDADFSFMNETLMQHYGLWEVNAQGKDLKKVMLPKNGRRVGLLGQGSILAVTSMPDRTSIIKRGEWVLKHLVCAPPPPAPPDVPPLKPTSTAGGAKPATLRQRTEQHRADPACAGCHNLIDPIGFGLENFDAVGRWRDNEGGQTIDVSGVYEGKAFKGAKELAAAIKADPRFASCIAEKVYTYALGKGRGAEDAAALDALGKSWAAKGHRLSELVGELVTSPRFLSPCGK